MEQGKGDHCCKGMSANAARTATQHKACSLCYWAVSWFQFDYPPQRAPMSGVHEFRDLYLKAIKAKVGDNVCLFARCGVSYPHNVVAWHCVFGER
jgi:hypothetical protein